MDTLLEGNFLSHAQEHLSQVHAAGAGDGAGAAEKAFGEYLPGLLAQLQLAPVVVPGQLNFSPGRVLFQQQFFAHRAGSHAEAALDALIEFRRNKVVAQHFVFA
jgi:hypothetical protein